MTGTSGIVQFENFPKQLKEINAWCVWGERKIPKNPKGGHNISSTKPEQWASYDDAEYSYVTSIGAFCGMGFCFFPANGYCGIDLDDCFDGEHLKPWAVKVLSFFSAGYIERSPSGRGLHIIVKGQKPGNQCKKPMLDEAGESLGEVEIYDRARYFTMTGHLYDLNYRIPAHAQSSIDNLYAHLFGNKKEAPVGCGKEEPPPSISTSEKKQQSISPVDIISLIKASSQKEKYERLAEGSLETALASYGGDHSSAKYALSAIIAWYTRDFSVMDTIFRGSALYSGKWAPNPKATGAAKEGKWARLGESEFRTQRTQYESEGNVYSPEVKRTTPEEDFTEVILTKEQTKGEKDYERHINLLADFGESRRDLLSGALHYKDGKEEWLPVFSRSFLGALRGECQARGKAYSKTKIENYLYRHENSLPPQLLLDLPIWDGEDRLGFMCSKLNLENVTKEVFEDIFKDWCAKLWQRIESPTKVQNRCLLLSGQQGVGKDYWVNSIFFSLGRYLSDLTLDGRNTKESDIGIVLSKSLVLFISEFEKTESIDIGTLKDIVTKATYTSVRKYDKDASTIINRCSVIGACNPSHIFRDVTGNRRFVFFRLRGGVGNAITWDYPFMDETFSAQCIAQIKSLGVSDYQASEESESIIASLQAQYTPDDPTRDILLDFESAVEAKALHDVVNSNKAIFRVHDLSDIFGTLAKNYSVTRRTIMSTLKHAGCQYRSTKCRWYGTRAACSNGKNTTAGAEANSGLRDCDQEFVF